tara:strand:+ start:172 stop:378 length:207 start_codon:yes stop_codon:yes gene_type:complete
MPGACECADEAAKDVKCCFVLDSYCWFKVLAWINMITMTIILLAIFAAISLISAGGAALDQVVDEHNA